VITASNSIQKLVLDVRVNVDKSNHEVFNKFSSIANSQAIPTISNYFDAIIPKEVVIVIDHLDLNLGVIKYEDLETIFKDKLLAALKDTFSKYFNEAGNYLAQSNNLFTVKNLPDNQLAFVKYYLIYGRAPWWAESSSINFSDSILQVINQSPSAFRKLLYEIGRSETVRKRLAYTLHESVVKKVIHILEPSQAEYIFQYHTTVTKLNRVKQTVKGEEKDFKRSLWYVILTYIIYNRGGVFNRREFLKQNLYNVSTLYNLQFNDLISLLYKGLKENKSIKENRILSDLYDDIFYLAQETNSIEINQKSSTNKKDKKLVNSEEAIKEQLAVLHYYLERGSFSISLFNYSQNDILSILDALLNYHSDLFIRYLKSVKLNAHMINRLYNLLPTSQFNQLIVLITPASLDVKISEVQKSFILFLINSKLNTQILISNDFKKSMLSFIVANNYSISFSELIKLFLKRISTQLHITYSKAYLLYEQDLKRQIQVKEFNLTVLQKISDQIENLRYQNDIILLTNNNLEDEVETNDFGIADFLKFVIKRGFIPWWGKDFLSKSLDKLLMDLFRKNPKEAMAIFHFASSQILFRNRFIQFFSVKVTKVFLENLWKNENDWKVYDLLESLLKSLPTNFKQPSNEAKSIVLLHSFWKILLEGNFSVFNTDKFIQLNFILLKKYHSFEIKEFITFLAANPLDPFDNNSFLTNEHFIEIVGSLETYSFSSESMKELANDNTITIDSWFELIVINVIFGNKKLSKTRKIKEISSVLNYFFKNLMLPTYLLSYVQDKQPNFFSYLLNYYLLLDRNKLIQYLSFHIATIDSPNWLKVILDDFNNQFSLEKVNLISSTTAVELNIDNQTLFENDDIFIATLLGFKPFSTVNNEIEKISNESFSLLIFILNNDKLPNKYESLNRFDYSFLVTILLRYINSYNKELFNQFLYKFSSFSDKSRWLVFKSFSGISTSTNDLLIAEQLIPLMNDEISFQNKRTDIIVSDKSSLNLSLKLNEWVSNEVQLDGLSKEDKLFQLFTYFLLNGKLLDSFLFLSSAYLQEFLRILIFKLEKIDSKKILLLLSNEKNDSFATNLVTNLFIKGNSIDERRIHSLFLSVIPKSSSLLQLQDDLLEFDLQFIDPSFINSPLVDLDFKELFLQSKGVDNISDELILDNSIDILIYFLLHKKREPQFKKITDNQFLIYLKEIIGFIFLRQSKTLREAIENPIYPLSSKLAVYSLFNQIYDSKDNAIKTFLQPLIESQIFKYIETIVQYPISTSNFKITINTILNSSLPTENINVLKLLQFIQSEDLLDDLPQSYLSDLVSKNMGNLQATYLKQILSLFLSSLSNYKDKNELSNFFVRFNSYLLSELKSLVSLDSYLRRLIQFLLYQNRSRAIYFFEKFLFFTKDINLSFSSEYFFIINKLRKLLFELVNASDYSNLSANHIINRDKPVLDKINQVVSDFTAIENSKVLAEEELTTPVEDYKESDESIYINNAGLVLFNPYITTFLSRLGMTEKGKFKDEESAFRSVHLLQLLVTEATYGEHELVLNKILCNLPVSSPVSMDIDLKPAEKQLAKELIEVTMQRWKKGSSGSKESFRASFLNRDGRLSMINEEWHLKVDQRGYDVILQTLPWSYGMIKLPWMLKPLIVEWI